MSNINIQPTFNEAEERFANQFETDTINIIHQQKLLIDKQKEKNKDYELLMVDKLTGLPSVFALNSLIESFDVKKYKPNTNIFCIYLDLKQVKEINDREGHMIGDEYVKECAQAFTNSFRTGRREDIIYHLSNNENSPVHRHHSDGDEFIVLLTCPNDKTNEVKKQLIQRLLKTKEETISKITNKPIDFRFGISSQLLHKTDTSNQCFFEQLIDRADKNLNLKRKQEADPSKR